MWVERESNITAHELRQSAETHLEEFHFAQAVEDYRASSLLESPDHTTLGNLKVAELNERVEFRRALSRQFPDSLEALLAEVDALQLAGFRRQAIDRCSQALNQEWWATKQIAAIRHARFFAAKDAPQSATFVADFIFIWHLPIEAKYQKRAKLMLLSKILEISSPHSAEAIKSIGVYLPHDPDLLRIIEAKLQQLAVLEILRSR